MDWITAINVTVAVSGLFIVFWLAVALLLEWWDKARGIR